MHSITDHRYTNDTPSDHSRFLPAADSDRSDPPPPATSNPLNPSVEFGSGTPIDAGAAVRGEAVIIAGEE